VSQANFAEAQPPVVATIAAVNDAATFDVLGAAAVGFWVETAASLTGLTLVLEVQMPGSTLWLPRSIRISSSTAHTTFITVTGTLTAAGTALWEGSVEGAARARVRASAITGGSCSLRVQRTGGLML